MKPFFCLFLFATQVFASDLKLSCSNNITYEVSQDMAKEVHQLNNSKINNNFFCTYINGVTSKKDEDTRSNEDDLIIFRGRYDHCSMGKVLIINPNKAKVAILNSIKMTVVNLTCKPID